MRRRSRLPEDARGTGPVVVCAFALVSCAAHFDVSPSAIYSGNPALEPGGSDPAAGGVLGVGGSLSGSEDRDLESLGVAGSVSAVSFAGASDVDYFEADAVATASVANIAFSRKVKPHGIELAGLHPRATHVEYATAVFYTFAVAETEFEERELSRLDSRTKTHMAMAPVYLGDSGGTILLGYNWIERDWHRHSDLKSQRAWVLLSVPVESEGPLAGAGGAPFGGSGVGGLTGFRPSARDCASALPSLTVLVGWERMDEFEGSAADPSREVSMMTGGVAYSKFWECFGVALAASRGPDASYVSNYQIETAYEAALSARLGESCRADLALAYEEADRSTGSDLSRWTASARAEWRLGGDWRVVLGLDWADRSSTDPGEDYDVFTLNLGVGWRP